MSEANSPHDDELVERTSVGRERHSLQNETVHKVGGFLSGYLTSSGRELQREDKLFYYVAGLGLLFTLLAVPLASWFLDPSTHWTIIIPGVMVILAAFVREWRKDSYLASRHSATADHTRKTVLRGREKEEFEIAMYWGYRPAAHDDLHKAIVTCRHDLFIAGIGLTTIGETLCDPQVIRSLATTRAGHANFGITIVFLLDAEHQRSSEEGGAQLRGQLERGRAQLRTFYKEFSGKLPRQIADPAVDFRTYRANMVPRHFLLKADEVIYAGSYLGHKQGAYSYLMKLRPSETNGLYELFTKEIDYLRKNTEPVTLDQLLTPGG